MVGGAVQGMVWGVDWGRVQGMVWGMVQAAVRGTVWPVLFHVVWAMVGGCTCTHAHIGVDLENNFTSYGIVFVFCVL